MDRTGGCFLRAQAIVGPRFAPTGNAGFPLKVQTGFQL